MRGEKKFVLPHGFTDAQPRVVDGVYERSSTALQRLLSSVESTHHTCNADCAVDATLPSRALRDAKIALQASGNATPKDLEEAAKKVALTFCAKESDCVAFMKSPGAATQYRLTILPNQRDSTCFICQKRHLLDYLHHCLNCDAHFCRDGCWEVQHSASYFMISHSKA